MINYKIKLKKGDLVKVRSGRDKGKTGKILSVHSTLNKVTVDGINTAKVHVKPTKKDPTGGIKTISKPIWVSKLGYVTDKNDKPSKIGYKIESGKKTRFNKLKNKRIEQ